MTSDVNIRELVLAVIVDVIEKETYSHLAIHQTLRMYQYLEKQERAFLTRLAEGTIESYLQLDYIINQFSTVKVNKMKPVIRNIIRMAVYQIKYMDSIPSSAACNEAVKLAKKKGFHNLSGFVNGVLRNISRKLDKVVYPKEETDPVDYLSILYSTPKWIIKKWLLEYDYKTVKTILEASFLETETTIHCNTINCSIQQLREKLKQEGITIKSGNYVKTALKISDYNYLYELPSFQAGEFQVQDESSMLAVEVAGIKENQIVLDVCAAPGGKSIYAANKLDRTGAVIARDITEHKVALIEENKIRSRMEYIKTEVWNALQLDEKKIEQADVVLADVPCSGLGVFGKKTDLKYKIKQENETKLIQLQRDILSIVQQYVKPNGVLIYSTCTINKKENIENVQWILHQFAYNLESIDAFLPESLRSETTKEGYLQLLPGIHKTDGFFIAKFRKKV